nr:hypothetical protein [Methanobrevibacter arboriphilus]
MTNDDKAQYKDKLIYTKDEKADHIIDFKKLPTGPASYFFSANKKIPWKFIEKRIHKHINRALLITLFAFILCVLLPQNAGIIVSTLVTILSLIFTYFIVHEYDMLNKKYEINSSIVHELQINFNFLIYNKMILTMTPEMNGVETFDELNILKAEGKNITPSVDPLYDYTLKAYSELKLKHFNNLKDNDRLALDKYYTQISRLNSLNQIRINYYLKNNSLNLEYEQTLIALIDECISQYMQYFKLVKAELLYYTKGTDIQIIIEELYKRKIILSRYSKSEMEIRLRNKDFYIIINNNYIS